MKKVFVIMAMLLMGGMMKGQTPVEIDEELLIGKWVPFSPSMWNNALKVTEVVFNEYGTTKVSMYDIYHDTWVPIEYADFYVTNKNKLHLLSISSNAAAHFVISDFWRDEDNGLRMKIRRFNESDGYVFYLQKQETVNTIVSADDTNSEKDKKYNTRGIRTEGRGGIYIQNGKKILGNQ